MRRTLRAVFVLVCTGALPVTANLIRAQDPKETENMNRQVYRAGINGTGGPICISCPPPDVPEGGKYSGTIFLEITVTSDGAVLDPVVLRGLGTAAAEIAKKQVQKWKFKPALGPDSKPVDCRTTVEVTFRNAVNGRTEGKRPKDSVPTPITVAQAEKLKIGYRGVVLGQQVFVPGTKIVDQAMARAICSVVTGDAGPELGEEFFREPGA
jgi:TonB family protein